MDRRERRKRRRQELFQLVANVAQGTCIGISATYYFYQKISTAPPLTYLHLFITIILCIVCLVSFGLWMTARIQLGINLTFRATAHSHLITSGLYSRFRHPIYYFGSLSLFFYLLLLEKYHYLLFFLVLMPMQIIRGMREQVVLKRKFGDDYEDYVQQVWL